MAAVVSPDVFQELRGSVLDHYRAAVTENPFLANQPISGWPWDRGDNDAYPESTHARLSFRRWAGRHYLTRPNGDVPIWLVDAAQGVLNLWYELGPAAPVEVVLPRAPTPVEVALGCGVALSDDDDRVLTWFVRWQVQRRTWREIREEFGVGPERESTVRMAVARMAARLGLTLREGKRGPPSRRR